MPDAVVIGISSALGTVIGFPIAWWSLLYGGDLFMRHRQKAIKKKAKYKARAMLRKRDREACHRCGHAPEQHRSEPDGCGASVFVSGSTQECECELYLARVTDDDFD